MRTRARAYVCVGGGRVCACACVRVRACVGVHGLQELGAAEHARTTHAPLAMLPHPSRRI